MAGTSPAMTRGESERRRRAGADHLARLVADAAEAVRAAAFEIIGVAGPEDAALAVDCHFQPAGDDDAAFLAVMHQRHAAGVAAGAVTLMQDLQRAAEQAVADLQIGDRLLADFGQLISAVKRLARPLRLDGEEFRQAHRDAVEDALERADRRVHLVGLDQRDRRIGDAGAFCKLPLRQLVAAANESESSTDIDAHRISPVAGVADRTNMPWSIQQNQWLGCWQKRTC